MPQHDPYRRDAPKAGLGAELAALAGRFPLPAPSPLLLTRPIPSSGERLPVVGIGTARNFDISTDAELAVDALAAA